MTDKTTSPPPAYFLSLSLENVRSFGEKQTISFARPDGRPAQWTIILGDNGVGKTTVLKALAGLETNYVKNPGMKKRDYSPVLMELFRKKWFPIRNNTKYIRVDYSYSVGEILQSQGLKINREAVTVTSFVGKKSEFEGSEASYSNFDPLDFICYGYGAGRATGN
ncbi:MAG: AAA family ATPase [Bacteroidota bacterium]|nr:AAA family ATPase [Bacteroidota bacterium]